MIKVYLIIIKGDFIKIEYAFIMRLFLDNISLILSNNLSFDIGITIIS